MNLTDLTRFPINTRGYTVIPCISLVYDNMHDSMIGLRVTVGLGSYEYGPTDAGVITGFDEKTIHVRVGSKVKKIEYDPVFVQLQVYQFDKRILFSNERVSEKELASINKDFYNTPTSRESEEKAPAPNPPKEKKESDDVAIPTQKKTPKRKASKQKKESKPVEPPKAKQESKSEYVPKFGIQWS